MAPVIDVYLYLNLPGITVVGALIMTCHTPIDDDALDEFDDMSFLTHELTVEKATELAEKLDAVGAFESPYLTYDEWFDSIPHLQGRFDYDGLDDLFLEPSSFIETETRTCITPSDGFCIEFIGSFEPGTIRLEVDREPGRNLGTSSQRPTGSTLRSSPDYT